MKSRIFVAALLAACLAACSSDDSATGAAAPASLASLPATLEGVLSSEAGDGGMDEDGNPDHFGGLVVGDKEFHLMIPHRVIAAAGLGEFNENVRVRATIGGKLEHPAGTPVGLMPEIYQVTALTKL